MSVPIKNVLISTTIKNSNYTFEPRHNAILYFNILIIDKSIIRNVVFDKKYFSTLFLIS